MTIMRRGAALVAGVLLVAACSGSSAVPAVVCVGEATTYLDWLNGDFLPDTQDAIEDPGSSSGDLLESLLRDDGFEVERRIVSDDADLIASAMRELADSGVAVVLTTGGTGFAPRDVTPEATRSVVEREAPGLAEAIRTDAIARTPHALLSRGIAGLRGATLIVNLPGSPGGCRDGFAVIQPALRHGLELAAGDTATPHRQT